MERMQRFDHARELLDVVAKDSSWLPFRASRCVTSAEMTTPFDQDQADTPTPTHTRSQNGNIIANGLYRTAAPQPDNTM